MASGFVLSAAAPDADGSVSVRLVGDVAGADVGELERGLRVLVGKGHHKFAAQLRSGQPCRVGGFWPARSAARRSAPAWWRFNARRRGSCRSASPRCLGPGGGVPD